MTGDDETDAQDLAEVFDETNTTADGDDIANPDMAPNVYDVTYEDGDSDESEARDEDFDVDLATDDELDELLDRDDGVDDDEAVGPDDEDRVTTEDEDSADYEADDLSDAALARSGYEVQSPRATRRAAEDARLDESLEDSFPASDPVSMTRAGD